MKFLILFLLSFTAVLAVELGEMRSQAEKLEKDGNWSEAYDLRLKTLREIDDADSGDDLKLAIESIRELRAYEKFDSLLDEFTGLKAENPYFMMAAGDSYGDIHSYGRMADNEFQRGSKAKGRFLNVNEQDRVRALQCYIEAWGEFKKDGDDEVQILRKIGDELQSSRNNKGFLWKFFQLTDLAGQPDYTDSSDVITSGGVPVGKDGEPVWIAIPESWESARSDGERWRWLSKRISEIDTDAGLQEKYDWLKFCEKNYGLHTLFTYSRRGSLGVEGQDWFLKASTLGETESISSLANGVKRFTLAKDYQYIPAFREMMRAGKSSPSSQAGDALVQIFLNRNQYTTAAETLEEVIKLHGEGVDASRSNLLSQIRGNWSNFGNTRVYYAGEEVEVPYTFRNGNETSLSLFKVDEEKIRKDIFTYLDGNPVQIDHTKVNFRNIGRLLITKKTSHYVEEELRDWTEKLSPKEAHKNSYTDLNLGKLDQGCYLLKSTIKGGNESWVVLWVRDLVILKSSEKSGQVFYIVDATSGQPVAGELDFFGYRTVRLDKREGKRRFNVETYRFTKKTDAEGRFALKQEGEFWDESYWYVTARVGERRAYLKDSFFDWKSPDDSTAFRAQKTLGITDRPVYRPGQTVHVKLWAGEARYDLGETSSYAGKSASVEIRDGRKEIVFEKKNLIADQYGGIAFEFDLEEEAALGNYQITVSGDIPGESFTFRVEEYKKPEYEVKVEAPTEPVALGESFEATISANYYHGAPVTEATVKVKVERNFFNDRWFPAAEWDWLYGAGYWWSYSDYFWYPGWQNWGCTRPAAPWRHSGRSGAPELTLEKNFPIGPDGKVKIKIDSSIAKIVHGDQDHTYSITAEVVDSSRRTIVGKGSVLASRQPFSVTAWLDRGYANIGDTITGTFSARTLDGKEVKGTALATLYRSTLSDSGEIQEEEIGQWTPEENRWEFIASKSGQYRISVVFTDEKDTKQEGATVFSVHGADGDVEGDFRTNALELIPDKKEYRPGETVKLLINVNQPDSRVWLFIRPSQGTARETKIIQITGKSKIVELPITLRDMPNFFIEAVTVSKGEIITTTREIVLPPEKRKLNVEITPAKHKLKPREKTQLTIKITDSEGKPYQGSAAISVYDKSLEYISGGSNIGEIVPFFWNWKRNYYRSGMEGSQQLIGHHVQLPRAKVMQWLGFTRKNVNFRGESDPFSLRGDISQLKGALLLSEEDPFGDSSTASSSTRRENKAPQQNAPEITVRSEFADLIKWVGSVETNEAGEASIDLEMPDNLTTWKIKTWAMGKGTRVGEGSAEIVTSKDLIIRLQAPRFFIEKDQVTLSAIVHNYHTEPKDIAVSLELDGGNLTTPAATLERRILIPAGGETRIDWPAHVEKEGETTIRMTAITADDSDAIEMKFPVYVHGIAKTESFSAAIPPEGDTTKIEFTIPKERRPSQSKLTLNYSPSVASAMVDALPYLASYPYGCTEQTLNRFVPTTIVHSLLKDLGHDLAAIKNKRSNLNPQQLGDPQKRAAQQQPHHPQWNPVWDENEVSKMERAGIAKLRDQQNPDGGWGWFSAYGNRSYPHTTAVIMHGLLIANENGVNTPNEMMVNGFDWLRRYEKSEIAKIKNYGKDNKDTKKEKADATDALVRRILGESGKSNQTMAALLLRDKNHLPIYAKALLGLEFHRLKDTENRDKIIRNIRQYLKRDSENQTAYLDLPNSSHWWRWYGSQYEAQAWFLKLLSAAEPKHPDTRGLVKYLINNRSNTTHWDSTRDTAYCLEAIGDYLRATDEAAPDLTLEILLDGKLLKTVEINKDNLFSYDSSLLVAGDILTSGKHSLEIRKTGTGPIYANAYLEYFTLENFITKTGLEIKVERTFYKLTPDTKSITAVDSSGQAIHQKRSKYKRTPLESGDQIKSGDLIEVELGIDSKNDYEYLLFEDWKAAGLEAVEIRSGYNPNGLGAYMELRDEKVSLFVQKLPRGRHNLSYRLRAEIPGTFSALPTRAEAIYAPELKANSNEMKISITE